MGASLKGIMMYRIPRGSRLRSEAASGDGLASLAELVAEKTALLEARLERIEAAISNIEQHVTTTPLIKEFYTTAEAAEILGKRPFTVREWARLQRIHAQKTHAGHGIDAEWRISREELVRIQNEGLLRIPTRY
jgi:hypothetical protein